MAPSLSTMRKEDILAVLSSNAIMMNALLERRRRLRKIFLHYLKENQSTQRSWILPRPSEFYEHAVLSMTDKQFKEEFRVNRVTFRYLVHELKEMERVDTHWRKCIPIEKRICIALYTLASSCEYRTVRNLFGVGKSTVCVILHQFCSLVVEKLKSKFVETPTTREKILTCVEDFEMWDFPQCMGSIDGTYIKIQPPKDDAHSYFCHKSFYSTVLLAVCDANYRFTYINVGSAGRCNDAFILRNSSLFKFLGSSVLRELSKPLGGVDVPVCLIGDAAFPLMPTLQKPYPDSKLTSSTAKHYNYRLSRARRVIENVFGRLKARFRILKLLEVQLKHVVNIVIACCIIHNLCESSGDAFERHWELSPPLNTDMVTAIGENDSESRRIRDGTAEQFQINHRNVQP